MRTSVCCLTVANFLTERAQSVHSFSHDFLAQQSTLATELHNTEPEVVGRIYYTCFLNTFIYDYLVKLAGS
jgi:hypothetical protein